MTAGIVARCGDVGGERPRAAQGRRRQAHVGHDAVQPGAHRCPGLRRTDGGPPRPQQGSPGRHPRRRASDPACGSRRRAARASLWGLEVVLDVGMAGHAGDVLASTADVIGRDRHRWAWAGRRGMSRCHRPRRNDHDQVRHRHPADRRATGASTAPPCRRSCDGPGVRLRERLDPGAGARGPYPDLAPMEAMAYVAACTARMRLGCAVSSARLHSPAHLALSVASVDQLSGGRLEVGIGTGGGYRQFAAFGADRRTFVARFNEGLELMRKLWTEDRVDHDGRFWQLKGAAMEPKPVQRPHPPIWFGGAHPSALRRAVAPPTGSSAPARRRRRRSSTRCARCARRGGNRPRPGDVPHRQAGVRHDRRRRRAGSNPDGRRPRPGVPQLRAPRPGRRVGDRAARRRRRRRAGGHSHRTASSSCSTRSSTTSSRWSASPPRSSRRWPEAGSDAELGRSPVERGGSRRRRRASAPDGLQVDPGAQQAGRHPLDHAPLPDGGGVSPVRRASHRPAPRVAVEQLEGVLADAGCPGRTRPRPAARRGRPA